MIYPCNQNPTTHFLATKQDRVEATIQWMSLHRIGLPQQVTPAAATNQVQPAKHHLPPIPCSCWQWPSHCHSLASQALVGLCHPHPPLPCPWLLVQYPISRLLGMTAWTPSSPGSSLPTKINLHAAWFLPHPGMTFPGPGLAHYIRVASYAAKIFFHARFVQLTM